MSAETQPLQTLDSQCSSRPYSETIAWTEVVASGDGALLHAKHCGSVTSSKAKPALFYLFRRTVSSLRINRPIGEFLSLMLDI